MVTTHFDLISGPLKKGYFGPIPKFPRPNFLGILSVPNRGLWGVQTVAWLIQHCYSPYGTAQLEKTGKKGSFGPRKAPFGALEVLGESRVNRFGPNYPRLARLG